MTHETPATIEQWAHETFGTATPLRAAIRANEEMAELLTLLAVDPDNEKVLEEVADVHIVLCHLAGTLGDLQAAIDKKMAINRARRWKLDGQGTGQHIEEAGE